MSEQPGPPPAPRAAPNGNPGDTGTFDAASVRLGLDFVAAGWAVAVLLGLITFHGASPGLLVGAALVAAGLAALGRGGGGPQVRQVAVAGVAVAAAGALAALVGLVLAAAGASGVRGCNAVVLVALVVGAFFVVATAARLTGGAGARRLCLRWRRTGAVLVGAIVVTLVVALLSFAAGTGGTGAGFWRAPFGRELPTPVPQVLLVVLAAAAAAAALATATAIEATRSWLRRLPAR